MVEDERITKHFFCEPGGQRKFCEPGGQRKWGSMIGNVIDGEVLVSREELEALRPFQVIKGDCRMVDLCELDKIVELSCEEPITLELVGSVGQRVVEEGTVLIRH